MEPLRFRDDLCFDAQRYAAVHLMNRSRVTKSEPPEAGNSHMQFDDAETHSIGSIHPRNRQHTVMKQTHIDHEN
jgi:hypothetical protein